MKYDVCVVGGGPGGYTAAVRAARLGGKVILVEKDEIGGTCLNRGCIPLKVLLQAAEIISVMKEAKNFGIAAGNLTLDLKTLMELKDSVVTTLRGQTRKLVENSGTEIVKGEGVVEDSNSVLVRLEGGRERMISCGKIILATGSTATRLPVEGALGKNVITSDDALKLESAPESIIIVGGGAVGTEFACALNQFGSKVTLLEMMPHLLPAEDEEITGLLKQYLEKQGIAVKTGAMVKAIKEGADGEKIVAVAVQGKEDNIIGKMVLMAAGRSPNLSVLGTNRIGVQTFKGGIMVDERMQTNVVGIFAIGDLVGKLQFAHVASAQGVVAADNAMGKDSRMDYRAVPRCVYTIPEMAAVGLTEKQAKDEGLKIKVGKVPFSNVARAHTLGDTRGGVKIIADQEYGAILGASFIGPRATEIAQEIVLAIKLESTVGDVAAAIHPHPTLTEALKEAAEKAST
ncbi:MAG TPA: dihydrolipoyl dehydrogenase [Candidatus Bathyarchaeia archaeon]|nr:dihydrolipoyl dehydrogenase [Candidatus Bathyarchaeia archaeon]